MSERAKISEHHRGRRAVVYVRQSTLAQVATNVESGARQYALVERAVRILEGMNVRILGPEAVREKLRLRRRR